MATQNSTPKDKLPARRFEVRKSESGNSWSWHAISPANGKITFQGEGHPTSSKAVRAIEQELNALGAKTDVHITVHGSGEPKVIHLSAEGKDLSDPISVTSRFVTPDISAVKDVIADSQLGTRKPTAPKKPVVKSLLKNGKTLLKAKAEKK